MAILDPSTADDVMLATFKVGDAVHLKGGSPKMTVTRVGNDADGVLTVHCAWVDGAEPKSASFPADAVKIAAGGGPRLARDIDFDL